MPEARPVARRIDESAADTMSLVRLGLATPQPAPAAPAPAAPAPPLPAPELVDEAEAAMLSAALTEAGIAATAEDQDAVRQLARLDADTVAAVTRWMRTKRTKPDEVLDPSK